jgi:phosphoglucosamine mutase
MGNLFGADGIRGVVNLRPLISEDLERIGRSIGCYLFEQSTKPQVLIARDTRESCASIIRPFLFGLLQSGVNVVDVGILPTPGVSYLTKRFGFDIGVMISASHNPIIENGIKLFGQSGHKFSGEQEKRVEDIFFSSTQLPMRIHNGSQRVDRGLRDFYITSILSDLPELDWKKVPLIIDCAQGAASEIAVYLVEKMGLRAILLNVAPDGTNANESSGSEHARRYPDRLATLLREQNWSVAVAFDGDADRALFVDQSGQIYNGDSVLAMLALSLYNKNSLPQNTLVTTLARNTGLRDHLRRYKIQVKETLRSGDKYVVELMEKDGYILGGEQVGHIIQLDDTHVTGDGIRTALLVMQLLAQNAGASLDDLTENMSCYPQVLAGVSIPRFAHIPNPENLPGTSRVIRAAWSSLEGLLRLEVRFASTEPLLRIMMESNRASDVDKLAWWSFQIGHQAQEELGFSGYPIEVLNCGRGGLITV